MRSLYIARISKISIYSNNFACFNDVINSCYSALQYCEYFFFSNSKNKYSGIEKVNERTWPAQKSSVIVRLLRKHRLLETLVFMNSPRRLWPNDSRHFRRQSYIKAHRNQIKLPLWTTCDSATKFGTIFYLRRGGYSTHQKCIYENNINFRLRFRVRIRYD